MPKGCVVGNCSNVADKTKNIAIHVIPFYGDDRPIAKSRRKQWVDFVRKKREEKWRLPNIQLFVRARRLYAEIRLRRPSGKAPSNKRRSWGFSSPSTDGRSGNRRRWKYTHRTCKAKDLCRNLTAAPVFFTFIRKT